jgi:3-deoxy-D-manno-octulosonic-acid transferase
MKFLYNSLIQCFHVLLPILGVFFKRLKIFYQDRKNTKVDFHEFIKHNNKPIIWTHVASLGEYEQVVPVLQSLKKIYPDDSYLISFFSDSGYRNKKGKSIADFETYLPLDTIKQSQDFVQLVNPKLAIFVKYDVWPNYLQALKKRNVQSYLVAARFRTNQIYFKFYGRVFRKALKSFHHIFVQDAASGQLLNTIDYKTWTHSGDTRYDRVSLQLEQDNTLGFVEDFLTNELCMVCGSTWREDEEVLTALINSLEANIKYVIAPHQINSKLISEFEAKIKRPSIRLSNSSNKNLSKYQVLIIDNVGMLTKAYSYADIAYVGGGFGHSGLHNILEPAAFGVPVFIGPNHKKFPEAEALMEAGGLKIVNQKDELINDIKKLCKDETLRIEMSEASKQFIKNQKGATAITIKKIRENFKD